MWPKVQYTVRVKSQKSPMSDGRCEVESSVSVSTDRPESRRGSRFRLAPTDRPTRRAQRGEENFGSEAPTDRLSFDRPGARSSFGAPYSVHSDPFKAIFASSPVGNPDRPTLLAQRPGRHFGVGPTDRPTDPRATWGRLHYFQLRTATRLGASSRLSAPRKRIAHRHRREAIPTTYANCLCTPRSHADSPERPPARARQDAKPGAQPSRPQNTNKAPSPGFRPRFS